MPPATTGESGDDVVEDVALSLFESSTIGDGGENDTDDGDGDDDCEESLSLLIALSLFDSVEEDEEDDDDEEDDEDDGHRGGDNGEGDDRGGNDDAAAIGVEDKDALLSKLELTILFFLVAPTLPLPPLTSPPTPAVVLRRRFCRPLF
jgi:hypothetical protein